MSPPYRITNARGMGFRLGYSHRASTTSEGRVKVCHEPTVCHTGTLKYSHQSDESEVFIELPTDKSLQFINSFSFIVIFSHSAVQREV